MLKGLEVNLLTLHDFPNVPDIVEDGNSYFENALKKARIVSEYTAETVLAEDSGLEVCALGGAPGIFSSRYAGDNATDESNVKKILESMQDVPKDKRDALYHCVLVFYQPNGTYEVFTGHWEGRIHDGALGNAGFGYDPVFYLPEQGVTVAQLPLDIKNNISHRAEAFAKFRERFKTREDLDIRTGRSAAR